ncbi:hypothetical protein [Streptomyces sp. NPDC050704]|uniref:hypothetical protein n=1 Tax=Streptomyces sp. NPDC050704 TaxID=3157219 RepID=UPI0034239E3F
MNRRTKTAVLGTALLVTAGVTGSVAGSATASTTVTTASSSASSESASATATSASATASEERRREAAALTGTAKLYRTAGDDIMFSFDAHLAARNTDDPLKATGTFRWSHHDANGEGGGWAKAKVDCLVTGGKVAVVSGVITDTDIDGVEGHRVGITVHDTGGTDRLGYSWAASEDMGPKDLPKCVGSAPFEKVKKGTGDFKVVPWNPDF